MVKLRRLRVHQYRNIAPGIELRFSDGMNVVLGLNGTGKTTLLELVVGAVKLDLHSFSSEVFHIDFLLEADGLRVEVDACNSLSTSDKYRTDYEAKVELTLTFDEGQTWTINSSPRATEVNGPEGPTEPERQH